MVEARVRDPRGRRGDPLLERRERGADLERVRGEAPRRQLGRQPREVLRAHARQGRARRRDDRLVDRPADRGEDVLERALGVARERPLARDPQAPEAEDPERTREVEPRSGAHHRLVPGVALAVEPPRDDLAARGRDDLRDRRAVRVDVGLLARGVRVLAAGTGVDPRERLEVPAKPGRLRLLVHELERAHVAGHRVLVGRRAPQDGRAPVGVARLLRRRARVERVRRVLPAHRVDLEPVVRRSQPEDQEHEEQKARGHEGAEDRVQDLPLVPSSCQMPLLLFYAALHEIYAVSAETRARTSP